MDVTDELLNLCPTISDPQQVAAGDRNRPSDADLRPLEPLPQTPQARDPPAADPRPMNPEDNRRLGVYLHVEVELTADVCPSGPARDAGDQGRDGRITFAGSRPEPARQGRGRGRSFDPGHGNGPPAHPRKSPPANMAQSCRDATRPRRRGGNRPSFEILASASVLTPDGLSSSSSDSSFRGSRTWRRPVRGRSSERFGVRSGR